MKKTVVKKLLAMGLSVSLLVSGVAAGNYASAAKKLSVSAKKITIYVGKKKTIKTNMSAKFSVSNKKIVSLKKVKKKQCTVVAKKKGTCTIKVKANKQVKKIKVTVKKKATVVKTKAPVKTTAPTKAPTAAPTETPVITISPTAVATTGPAVTEEVSAIAIPTQAVQSTNAPIETIIPSFIPVPMETPVPSTTPEGSKTEVPQVTGIVEESEKPIVTASIEASPTAIPTVVPLETPTAEPTVEPTAEPTVIPTIEPTAEPTKGSVQLDENLSMEDRVNYFGFKMFEQLKEENNVMISPYSIMMAMTLLDNAADGETKAEIEKVLGIADLDKWNEEFSTYYKTYLNKEDKDNGFVLRTANAIWKNDTNYSFDSEVQTKYLKAMNELYGSENISMDFVTGNPKDQINRWVEEKTEGMIKDLIQKPIGDEEENVLVNTLYFTGKWQSEFAEYATRVDADFYGKNGTTKVDMMHEYGGNYKYLENDTLAVAEFPFRGEDMVMDVVLAKENASTIEEFNKLSNKEKTALFQNVSASEEEKLNVYLPKFKMTYGSKSLLEQLHQMGISNAFSEQQAELPGLTGDNHKNIFVKDVVHQTVIEVTETGVKAAAATGMISGTTSVEQKKPVLFEVNKPFVYVIRDTKTNMIYFVGQIEDLTEENRME